MLISIYKLFPLGAEKRKFSFAVLLFRSYVVSLFWMSLFHLILSFDIPRSKFISMHNTVPLSRLGPFFPPPVIRLHVNDLLFTAPFSFLTTKPNHFNYVSCTFLITLVTLTVPLMISFLILFFFVTPLIHVSFFISGTSIFLSPLFFIGTISNP